MNSPATASVLTLSRSFKASAEDLWEAWTNRTLFAQWFNPGAGMDAIIQEWNPVVGGKCSFLLPQPDGSQNPQSGVFHAMNRPFKLIQGAADESFMILVNFLPTDPGAIMTIRVSGVPDEHHVGATAGWQASFAKLAALTDPIE